MSFKGSHTRTCNIDHNPITNLNWARLGSFEDEFLAVQINLRIKSNHNAAPGWRA
jgi:hypothetical protein